MRLISSTGQKTIFYGQRSYFKASGFTFVGLFLLFSFAFAQPNTAVQKTDQKMDQKADQKMDQPSLFSVEEGPPPGFERFEKEQSALLDLSFGGELAGQAMAIYDAEKIWFQRPEQVADLLVNIEKSTGLLSALSQKFDHNSHLICSDLNNHLNSQTSCGHLETKDAAVIFDDSQLKIELYLVREFYTSVTSNKPRFLQPTQQHHSFLAGVGLSSDNSLHNTNNNSLNTNLQYSNGQQHIDSQIFYNDTDESKIEVEQLTFSSDKGKDRVTGGYFRTRGFRLLSQQEFLGARAETTLETRVDRDQALGSDLSVFLEQRSHVSILRDNQLLSSRSLPPGHHSLDTSRLPDGAYEVTLKIVEVGGKERSERRFFAKTNLIPPKDQDYYFIEAGVFRSSDNNYKTFATDNSPTYGLGYGKRLWPNIGIEADLNGSDTIGFSHLSVSHLDHRFKNQLSGFASTEKDYGLGVNINYSADRSSVYLDYSHVHKNTGHKNTDLNRDDILSNAIKGYRQLTWQANYSSSWGQLALRAQLRKDQDADQRSYSIGPRYQRSWLMTQRYVAEFSTELAYTENHGLHARADVSFRLPSYGHYSGKVSTGFNHRNTDNTKVENQSTKSALVSYDDKETWKDKYQFDLHAEDNVENRNTEFRHLYQGTYGQYRLYSNYQDSDTAYDLRYGGDIDLTIASDERGIVVGGDRTNRSAIVIDLKGSAQNVPFKLLVDGAYRGTIEVNSSVVVPVTPYQVHHVTLEPSSVDFTHFNATPKQVTTFPGNVVRVEWQVDHIVVIIAQIKNQAGEPIVGARVDGLMEAVLTMDDGWLQGEMSDQRSELKVTDIDGNTCTIIVPSIAPTSGILDAGVLICQ